MGSNLGHRRGHLRAGIWALEKLPGVDLQAVSSLYETEAWGGPENQNAFLNIALTIRSTALSPTQLLENISRIEAQEGRIRGVANGPRTLDIDILLYGDAVIQESNLDIPHIAMHQRSFVLLPAAEIAASMKHPVLQQSIGELARLAGDEGLIRVLPGRKWFHVVSQSTYQ